MLKLAFQRKKAGVFIKIIKLHRNEKWGNCHILVDKIPEITYEKIGLDYIGSAIDSDGNIVFSDYLKYSNYKGAFGGRELTIKMKDGSVEKIKDFWYDTGYCKEHGDFVGVGLGTLKSLQDCYVYCSYNINEETFEKMLDDYYSREKEYEYYEIEKWCKLKYKWYDVVIDGIKYPYMVNRNGNFVHKYSKEPIFPKCNYIKSRYYEKVGKFFDLCLFELKYKDNSRLIKIERKMIDVLKESLPFTEEEIKKNCKIK